MLIFDNSGGFVKFIDMTHPPSLDRKSLKSPDAFVSRGTQLLARISRSKMGFAPILGLGIALAAGFYGLDFWEEKKEQESWTAYYQALKATESKKWEQMEAVSETNPKSRPGMLAAVEVADHYFELAEKEEIKKEGQKKENALKAAEWYQKSLRYSDLLPAEKQLLLINQGNAEELAENFTASLASYEKAFSLKGPAKALALIGVGRSQQGMGEAEKAVQTFEKVFMEFASTEYAKLAKMFWRNLKSPLLNQGSRS